MSQISQIKKIYHAAIYVRLSKEDGAVASHEKTESNSIANQKSLIRDFLENKNDIEVVQEYVDDGFSGSNFERPAFQMMLEDIKKGKIDCVVTKDLSRFGREYIDSGMYIERLFPAMGVRFIAINDGIDSGEAKSQSDEIIIPFKNLINDAYCRDISIKIRSHLEIKRKQGDVITAFVPYGYKKNDKDKHKLEIDVYAANVVKDIFRMKLHGKSQDAIACELNSSGILPPAEYKASTGSNYQTCFKTKEKSEWTSVMVRRILTNEVYIGNLVQGKQTTPNHKVKKTIIKEKCEWIRIEKNHEPVITDRDFEVVQRLLAMDTRTSPDREEVYPLSGVVTCGGCGIPMVRKTSKVGGKTYAYYLCATHKDSKQCSSHRISTDVNNSLFHDVIQYSALLVAIIYIVIRKYSNKELIRNSFLVLIGILCYVSSGFSGLLMTVLAIILMPNNYLEIILKMILKEETILFGIIVIFSLLGVLDMGGVKINKGSYITDGVSLGFTHPNMLAAQGTSIILLYLCLNKDKLKTRHYIVSLMCEILLFVLSKGRSSFFLGIFAIILIGMSKMNIIKKIILKFLPFAYWAILGALIFCMFIYARDNGTSAISGLINDGFFNGRIGLAYRSLLVYPITIFGKAIDTSIWNQYQYYSLDNGQVMVLLEYGIVGFLTYFYIIQTILKEVKKEEEVVWGIIIIVFMIWSMYEGTMYFIGKNFVFLFLGLNKNSMVVNLKKEKKYDS